MSQQSLLEDVHTWTRDECRTQIDFAVPKLVSYLQNTEDVSRVTEIVHIICSVFLPVVPREQAESVVFSKVAHKTAECVENSLNRAQELALQAQSSSEDVRQDVTRLVQACQDLIGCLGLCVAHIIQDGVPIPVSYIHSLSASVLHVVERSYSHCKKSGEVYGQLMALVSQKLSSLFRQANELQMAFISLAEKIIPEDNSEQDVQDLVVIVHGLFEISQVVATLEVKVMLTLWKAISRISCQHKTHLSGRLELDVMLTFLASNMSSAYIDMFSQSHNQVEPTAINKLCKVLGFQMRVLQMLLKEFYSHASSSLIDVYRLLLIFKSQVPPCLGAKNTPASVLVEVDRQIMSGVSAFIALLSSYRPFVSAVCQSAETPFDGYLPKLLLLLDVMDALQNASDDILSLWMDVSEGPGLFSSIFDTVSKCHTEMNMAVTMTDFKSQDPSRRVCLYEHIVTRVAAFVASLPAAHFPLLEKSLLTNVLGRRVLPAVLAMDLWCFLARYSLPDICLGHCMVLAQLLQASTQGGSPQCCHLVLLLSRLLRFMAHEDQAAFIQAFPLDSHHELWSVIPLAVFVPSHLQNMVENLVSSCITILNSWCNANDRTAFECTNVINAIMILNNICSSTGVMEQYVSDGDRDNLCCCCMNLWNFQSQSPESRLLPWAFTKSLLKVTACITTYLNNQDLLKIIRIASTFLSSECAVHVRLAVLSFLLASSKMKIQPDSEQCKVFDELSKLFSAFLEEANPALQQIGLETFANFAEETPYESIVTSSLEKSSNMQERVIDFLKQAGDAESAVTTSIEEVQHFVRRSEQCSRSLAETLYPAPVVHATPEHSEEMADEQMSSLYTSSLGNLRRGVCELTKLRGRGALPEWVTEELDVIQMQLSELL